MPTFAEITGNIQSREYRIVRLDKQNLADLAKLHEEVYGTIVAADHFPRKYNTAYTGVENVGFIAYNANNLPVAYHGVMPCFIQYGNQVILAAQSGDVMTDPQHRYKGMFVELSNMTFELCRELGILLLFGFPNQNSWHGAVNKLGWKMTETMTCFTIPVKSLPLEWISKRAHIFNSIYKKYCNSILQKKLLPLQGVANSVLADGFAGVCRSPDYLHYKTYSSAKVIGLDGAKIWFNTNYGMMMGDMEGINEMNFIVVMNKLKGIAKKLGIRQIQFHCSPGTALHELFSANYNATPSYPMLFQDFGSAITPEKIKFTFADIDIF